MRRKALDLLHHPFTSPKVDDISAMQKDPGGIRSRAYDMVLNGTELGGGSIRIHDQDMQSAVFRMLGISDEQARKNSASCWTRSSPVARRTAASPWGWTGW